MNLSINSQTICIISSVTFFFPLITPFAIFSKSLSIAICCLINPKAICLHPLITSLFRTSTRSWFSPFREEVVFAVHVEGGQAAGGLEQDGDGDGVGDGEGEQEEAGVEAGVERLSERLSERWSERRSERIGWVEGILSRREEDWEEG
jgi:hypothetical protein